MADPEVVLQKYRGNYMLEEVAVATLPDALAAASTWLETTALEYGEARVDLIFDVTKCPNRVDQTHQPAPAELVGSTMYYSCVDCTYIGTRTVITDPAAMTWENV